MQRPALIALRIGIWLALLLALESGLVLMLSVVPLGAEAQEAPAPDGPPPGEAASAGEAFPRPPALAAQVAFWIQVYTTYTTSQVAIHDSERLGVIYGVVDLSAPETPGADRLRRRQIDEARELIVAALKHLAEEPGAADLSETERKVKAAWGEDAEPQVFQAAAGRVRAQLGQADRFRAGVQRSGAYLPHMRAIMAELGLPEELLALPHVESSFDPNALSHRGASGIWQWTRPTGRLFMRIDRSVDERRDPLLATRASGVCLRRYHEELGSWPLAITAYNHGIEGMRRARAEHGTDIVAIIRAYQGRAFKFASRNFYTEFLAALDVSRDISMYFGDLVLDPPLALDRLRLPRPLAWRKAAELAGMSQAELARLNPALLPPVTSGKRPIPDGYELRLPGGRGATLAARLGIQPAAGSTPMVAGDPAALTYRVRRGDTLSRIARRYGTDVDTLRELNSLATHTIYAGQMLRLPATNP